MSEIRVNDCLIPVSDGRRFFSRRGSVKVAAKEKTTADTKGKATIMTGRLAMRAKTDMTPQSPLMGDRAARIPGDPSSRSYYKDKGPAIFR